MQRENKAMAGRQLILIQDRRTKGVKARVCVDRARNRVVKGGGGEMPEKKKQRLTHILPRPFILFQRVRLVSNQKAGAPFGSARPYFFLRLSRSFSTFDPFYTRPCRQKIGVRACTPRQERRSLGRHPVNLDNEPHRCTSSSKTD